VKHQRWAQKSVEKITAADFADYCAVLDARRTATTDEAKALTKRTVVSALVVLLVLMVFRALLPWVLVALVGWWVWKAVSK